MSEALIHGFFFQLQFLISTLIDAFLCIGVGGWVFLFTKKFQSATLGMVGALGILGVGILALFTNFFLPLDAAFFWVLSVLSIIGWGLWFKRTQSFALRKELLVLVSVIALYWLIGLRRVLQSDTGLYHVPIIHWMQLGPLPLGLGTIHSRFSTWNFWFSVCGGVGAGNVLPLAIYGMNMVLVAFASVEFYHWIKNRNHIVHFYGVSLLFFISLLDTWYFSSGQKSPNADFAGAIFSIWALAYVLQRKEPIDWVNPTLILSGLGILTKLNQAPWVLCFVFAIAWSWMRDRKNFPIFSVVSIGIAGILMVAKTVWTSGCLVFPVVKTCFATPWSVDRAEVISAYSWVLRWARWPGGPAEETLHTWKWFPSWWEGNHSHKVFEATALMILLFLVLKYLLRRKLPRVDGWGVGLPVVGAVYWFTTAPDIRFGFGYFLMIFAIYCGSVLGWFFQGVRARFKPVLMAVMILALVFFAVGQVRKAEDFGMNTLVEPQPEFEVQKNKWGQSILHPQGNECWRLPVPCTPYFDDDVFQSKWMLWTTFEKKQ